MKQITEINSCKECKDFELIENGNTLIESKISYWCNDLNTDIYNKDNIDQRCNHLKELENDT